MEIADFEKMEEIRARVDAFVEDPTTAETLKPYYRMFCKRPTFNDDYLPTFNRPNVKLVDTDGKGVERITEKGVVVNGVEYEVDCIIFATGFEVGTSYTRRAGFDVVGRGGKALTRALARRQAHAARAWAVTGSRTASSWARCKAGSPRTSRLLDETAVQQSHTSSRPRWTRATEPWK